MSKLDQLLGINRQDPTDALGVDLAEMQEQLVNALIEMRKKRNLSQDAVAELIGRDQAVVSNFERLSSNPNLATIRRYALAVGARIQFEVTDAEAAWGHTTPGHTMSAQIVGGRAPQESAWSVR